MSIYVTGLDSEDAQCRKYNCIDTLVHDFCKLFVAHGMPEYACGAQLFPDYLELMSQSTCSDSEYFGSCMEVRLHRLVESHYFVSASNASKIIFLKYATIKFLSEAENLGGQGGLSPPTF